MPNDTDGLQLRIQSRYDDRYWLDVVVPSQTTLTTLDSFLRRTWLECCGHLSAFSTSGRPAEELSPRLRVREVFARRKVIGYVYDFGSSTELVIKLTKLVSAPGPTITLLARNEPPSNPCDECGLPAVSICADCSLQEGGLFCEEHAEDHPCGEERLLPVVNSPRMGVCGYCG